MVAPMLVVAPHADADLEHDPIRRRGDIGKIRYERLELVTRTLLCEEARLRVRSDRPELDRKSVV